MKIQILPNWCKKIGLAVFVIAYLINHSMRWIVMPVLPDVELDAINNTFNTGIIYKYIFVIPVLPIIGMLIYMLSKEKVEDDYINKLRLESFQLTTIVGLFVAIILFILNNYLKVTLDFFIFPFIWCYLILFFIKKRMYL